MRVFISAGEASGDLYASRVVEALRARDPVCQFFGCAGPNMQAAGVRPVVDSRAISVVGLVEVLAHVPRIWRAFRTLARAVAIERPDVAVLTDSPDFHLRLAKKIRKLGIPIVYLIAPQAWAWRTGRVNTLRKTVRELLCIFPFEEAFFRSHGVNANYIGHPLTKLVRPSLSRKDFFATFCIDPAQAVVTLLPGSRHGEVERHLPYLLDAAARIARNRPVAFILALPKGFGFAESKHAHTVKFWERNQGASIQVREGSTWDALAHSNVALAASGTVTMEAALLSAPMVTFYRVNALSWLLGRRLVRAPFLSMVNLVAGRKIAPELIQGEMTGERIAAEAIRLLEDAQAREEMLAGLAEVKAKLVSDGDPMERAAEWIEKVWMEKVSSERKQTVIV